MGIYSKYKDRHGDKLILNSETEQIQTKIEIDYSPSRKRYLESYTFAYCASAGGGRIARNWNIFWNKSRS